MRRRSTLLFALGALALPATPEAATLHAIGTLGGPVVRLSDLFDDSGPNADRVLGPSPAPGGRVVVEAAQLAAIARQFGVDWRPVSPAERIILERPGRMVPREQVFEAVRQALDAAGAPADCDIELPGLALPLVPPDAGFQPTATQLNYEASTGRFTATLLIAEGVTARIVGRAYETIEAPVAAGRLLAGMILGPADMRLARVRAGLVRTEIARLPGQAIGKALRHTVPAGQPLPLADLQPPALVQKGGLVLMQLQSPGLTLTSQGQALEPGALGERIRVLNPASRAVIDALVIGPGQVRIEPGSAPIVPAARGRSEVAAR